MSHGKYSPLPYPSTNALLILGSVEEEEDLLDFYVDFKGNMDKIIDHMFFADTAQEQRYIDIIDAAIAANRVKSYAAYGRTKNNEARWKKAKREAKEADQHIVDLGLGASSLSSLFFQQSFLTCL